MEMTCFVHFLTPRMLQQHSVSLTNKKMPVSIDWSYQLGSIVSRQKTCPKIRDWKSLLDLSKSLLNHVSCVCCLLQCSPPEHSVSSFMRVELGSCFCQPISSPDSRSLWIKRELKQLSTKLLKHHWKLLGCLSSNLYCTRDKTYRSNCAKKLEQLYLQTLVLAGALSAKGQHTSSPLAVFSFWEVQSSGRVPVVVYQPVLPAAKVLRLGSMSHPGMVWCWTKLKRVSYLLCIKLSQNLMLHNHNTNHRLSHRFCGQSLSAA